MRISGSSLPVSINCEKDVVVGIICHFETSIIDKSHQTHIASTTPKYENEKIYFVEIALKNHSEHLPLDIGVHFEVLENLLVQFSSLKYLKRNHFETMTQIEVLSLIYNQIESIPSDTFHDLENLRHIDLANNKLKILHLDLLKNSLNLMNFYAPNNEIVEIPLNFFDNNLGILNIDLQNNDIKQFNMDVNKNFTSMNPNIIYFNLLGNLNDCNLKYELGIKYNMANSTVIISSSNLNLFQYDICTNCISIGDHNCNLTLGVDEFDNY